MVLDWAVLKSIATARSLSIQWIDLEDRYWLGVYDGIFQVHSYIHKTAESDATSLADFEANFKATGNKSFTDANGALMIRPKAAKAGWVFGVVPVEVTTSKLDSLYSQDSAGNSRFGISVKFYNASNAEVTDPANEATVVKTVIDFEPNYDYEIIGGMLQQKSKPTTNTRLWVLAAPDIPANYGGSKEMIGGINLAYIDPTDKVQFDGRATKYMQYNATDHRSKLRAIVKHDAGVQHDIMITFELYRS